MREFQEFQNKGMATAAKGKGAKFNMNEPEHTGEPEPRFRLSAETKSDLIDFAWFMSCFVAIMVFFWVIY